jgi:hypothetical protein
MKKLAVFVLCLPLLVGCSSESVEPLSSEVALQPCTNRFTGNPDSYTVITKHTSAYATVKKSVYKDSFTNIESISFYIEIEGYREGYIACNLPEIFKKDGQKIKFNGTTTINTNPLADTQPTLELTAVKSVK